MPAKHLIHPITGKPLKLEEAATVLDRDCGIPPAVTALILADLPGTQTHVRPSDLQPDLVCRRQKIWMAAPEHEWGVNPLKEWAKIEGTLLHKGIGTAEIDVPIIPITATEILARLNHTYEQPRVEVCGVPMRGKIDDLTDAIEDVKTKSPNIYAKYPPKDSPDRRPIAYVWEPKNDQSGEWLYQLSAYGIMLEKSGQVNPGKGRVRRIYRGLKLSMGNPFKTFEFKLLTEEQLESAIGPWMRGLANGLTTAQHRADAWKDQPADGRKFTRSNGSMWLCEDCPLKAACDSHDNWAVF